MALVLTSGPGVEPITLAEAKAHLRIDGSVEDTLILSLVITSRLHIEAALGLALITQGWSYFIDAWADMNAAHLLLLERHPEIRADPVARGLLLGKLAFGHAALKQRRAAWRCAQAALRANWREPRTPIAVLVLLGLSPKWVTTELNRRGHGI